MDETLFECVGDKDYLTSAPAKSRLSRGLIFSKQCLKFEGDFKSFKLADAVRLSKLCGAKIVDQSQTDAATVVIVGIETSKADRKAISDANQVPVVSVVWVLDCISNWRLIPILDYKIN